MKFVLSLFLMLGFVSSTFARPLDTSDKAKRVLSLLAPKLSKIEGVNGYGVTGCNAKTGAPSLKGDFVHCISILTETKDAYEELIETYPVGTKIKGVYITVEQVGVISPEPNASGGN